MSCGGLAWSLEDKLFDASLLGDEQLAQRLAPLPRPLVITNGVFDVLHRGHVGYLHAARQIGGSLIVALNTDASVRALSKGADRPLNHDMDRALVLAGLAAVDAVTFFAQPTPLALLARLRPDIYVKGGDYNMEELEETRLVRSWGGIAKSIAFLKGYSTTSLVHRVREGGPGRED